MLKLLIPFILVALLFNTYDIDAQTTIFNYTGAMQTYIVPAGVTSLDIDLSGARGGYGASSVNNGGPNVPGFGGRVQTTLDVTPGQILYIFVGGTGANGNGGAVFNSGGYNGGGDGYRWASAGGGASDIRIGGTTLNDRVIVAGGGGGYGDNSFSGDFGGNGGDLIGADGEAGGITTSPAVGTGGTQSAGGTGGQESAFYGVAGSGLFGLGGDAFGDNDGGGGGGGYYGGGAGSYAGGGGGSSYTNPSLTSNTTHTQGFKNGAGEIIITENCSTIPVPDAALSDLTGACSVIAPTPPTATSCSGTFTGTPDVTFPITSQGTTVVTWTYDDGNGNTSTQTQNVIIDDVTAPVPNTGTLASINAECSVTSLTSPTATDNCAGTITATHNATLPITTQGTTVVTWNYDDGNGHTTTQTQNVIINDVTAPVPDVTSLSNVSAQCEVTSLSAPTATDNCSGIITGTHNATLPISSSTTITWTYDDGNGNTSTQTQNVVINDVTAPVADVATLSDVSAQCEVTSLSAPTATDNCSGTITGTHNATLPITTQGTTVVTWTYDDGNGNTSTQSQNVIINDATAPVADAGSLADITSECEVTSLTPPSATDNCAGSVTGTHNATLPITTQGTTVVTWTYDDGNGNTSTQTQNVIISDLTAPVADAGSLSPVSAECQVTSISAPTATDNCAGTVTGVPDVSFPITTQGTTLVTWTYDDGNGNSATQTQNVIISDVTAPVADNVTLSDINSECEVTPTAPTATDNCVGSITGTPDVSFPITATGTTTVTWTYDDGNGNTSTQMQDVIITPIDNSVTVVDATTLSADALGYTYQWVDCNDNNAPIAGETNQTFEATANGSYAVIIDNGVCSVTSTCFDITTVGLDNNELIEINVYPNPTSGVVNIESSTKIESIEVMNALGQTVGVYSTNQETIDIIGERGVYFLKITTEGDESVVRVVKN